MSKESTKAAFARATGHLLLNLDSEERDSLRTYGKSEERLRMEQLLKQEPGGTKELPCQYRTRRNFGRPSEQNCELWG